MSGGQRMSVNSAEPSSSAGACQAFSFQIRFLGGLQPVPSPEQSRFDSNRLQVQARGIKSEIMCETRGFLSGIKSE